jgi:hypothetical protein
MSPLCRRLLLSLLISMSMPRSPPVGAYTRHALLVKCPQLVLAQVDCTESHP